MSEELKPYPNLEAIMVGTISGKFNEWPKVRKELQAFISATTEREKVLARRILYDHENILTATGITTWCDCQECNLAREILEEGK